MKANSVFKKCLMFIFVCALLLMFAVPAMAKAPIAFSEKVTSNNNIVLYGIEISSESDVCGLSIELKYSEDQLKLRDCVVGQILDGGIAKSNTNIGRKLLLYLSWQLWWYIQRTYNNFTVAVQSNSKWKSNVWSYKHLL